jgi:hypothetical protein
MLLPQSARTGPFLDHVCSTIIGSPENIPLCAINRGDLINLAAGEFDAQRIGHKLLEIGRTQHAMIPIAAPIGRQRKMKPVENRGKGPTDRSSIAVTFADVMEQGGSEGAAVVAEPVLHSAGDIECVALIHGILFPKQRRLLRTQQSVDPILLLRAERSTEEHAKKTRR